MLHIIQLYIATQKAEKNLLQSEESFDYMIFMISCDNVLLDSFYQYKEPLRVYIRDADKKSYFKKYHSLRLPKIERLIIKKDKQGEKLAFEDYFSLLKHPIDTLTISAKRTGEKIKWCLPLIINHPGKLQRVSFSCFLIFAKDLKRLFSA